MNGYLYDPHTHTRQTSACADLDAAESAERYAQKGFAGFVVTDHIHPEYVARIDRKHSWDDVVDHYLTGYHIAQRRGRELGLDVILGLELRFEENENDYLIYGIDEAWLRAHPYPCLLTAREFFQAYHDEVLIIQAHPYRDGNTIVFENAFHGVELINAHPRHQNNNFQALELCRRHPDYLRLAGSDAHQPGDEARAGVLLPRRVSDSFAYKQMIETKQFQLWSPAFPDLLQADQDLHSNQEDKKA